MRLELIDRRATGDPVAAEAWFEAAGRAVAGLGREDWVAAVVLVDDRTMARLNGEYRDIGQVTDVLSFGYLERTGPGRPDLAAGAGAAAADLWLEPAADRDGPGREPTVGELVLAPGFVAARCADEGWDPHAEFVLLVVHGCLHILGWDHQEDDERLRMQEQEAAALGVCGLDHPLLEQG